MIHNLSVKDPGENNFALFSATFLERFHPHQDHYVMYITYVSQKFKSDSRS